LFAEACVNDFDKKKLEKTERVGEIDKDIRRKRGERDCERKKHNKTENMK
jgi:hypothetical protein